jgi:hypothetical protein
LDKRLSLNAFNVRMGVIFVLGIMMISGYVMPAVEAQDQVEFLGLAAITGGGDKAAQDLSGLPHTLLEDGVSYQDSFDGFGSAIAYTGYQDRYVLLADRGPNKIQYKNGEAVDNTTSYANRFQIADIALKKSADNHFEVAVQLKGTSLLKNEKGRQLIGISTAFGTNEDTNLRRDTEGIRVAPDGTVWTSDEYGPYIDHFNQKGQKIGSLEVPAAFLITHQGATLAEEMKNNTSGRYTNRGGEGLAISPDGKVLVIALQGALIQDGGLQGKFSRFLVYDLANPKTAPKQLMYRLDSAKTAISEILAVNDHQFLVDERDGVGGPKGVKLLYLVDFKQSEKPMDVSSMASLPVSDSDVASRFVPLQKKLFADIGAILNAAKPFTTSAGMPDKIEGYAFGPDLPDGRHLLLATNDNDFSDTYPDYIFAFAVSPSTLPEFQALKLKNGVTFRP